MCGIIGAVNFSAELDLSTLQHRGPDGQGQWSDGDFCRLGHTRLSIIDLDARASQPMVSRSGRFVIVFNGEIYNYRELKKEFLSDFDFRTSSDTEVLLELWEGMGPDSLRHLRGMFGFAIWDRKEKNYSSPETGWAKNHLFFIAEAGHFVLLQNLMHWSV